MKKNIQIKIQDNLSLKGIAALAGSLMFITLAIVVPYKVLADTDTASSTTMASSTDMSASTTLMFSPMSGMPGTTFTIMGSGFAASEPIWFKRTASNGSTTVSNVTTTSDASGTLSLVYPVPNIPSGLYTLTAYGSSSGHMAMSQFTITDAATSTATTTTPVATTTAYLTLSSYSGTPSSMITAMGSGFMGSEMVNFQYGGVTTSMLADASGTVSTPITIPAGAAMGQLPITATGSTSARVAMNMFYVIPAMGTSTATTTTPGTGSTADVLQLQMKVTDLQSQVDALKAQIAMLFTLLNGNNGGGTGTTTPTTPTIPGDVGGTAQTVLDNPGPAYAGKYIDLGGRNFGHEESVQVTSAGVVVANAHADGGGNFTTGWIVVPNTPGVTKTYTLTGMTSGIVRSKTVTILP